MYILPSKNIRVYETLEMIKILPYIKEVDAKEMVFYNNRTAKYIPFFDTSEITNFKSFFQQSKLFTIPELDTSKGENFAQMFMECENLAAIPHINTSNGTDFNHMFQRCENLKYIPELDTSNGTDFNYMFSGAGITSIPHLDTSKGTNFSGMFSDYCKIKSIPPLDLSNGTGFFQMFSSCYAKEIPTLNLSKGTNMTNMFSGCSHLRSIEKLILNSARTSSMTGMFSYSYSLKDLTIEGTIKVDSDWRLDYCRELSVESMTNIINAFEDNTGESTTYTVYFGSNNFNSIPYAVRQIATSKNINLAKGSV